MYTSIYMIRHAESPFVLNKEATRGLSDQGKLAANTVFELMKNVRVDVAISSPYARARQTIDAIAAYNNLPIVDYEGLRERQLKGAFKLSKDEIDHAIEQSFIQKDFHLQDGESVNDVQKRAIPIMKQLLTQHEGKNIIIGTHGNVMTIILNYFDSSYGYAFWKQTTKPDIYKLTFNAQQLLNVHRLWQP